MILPTVTLAMLKRVLVLLEPARFSYLVRGFLKLKDPRNVLLGAQLQLILADWLTHLGFISDQQVVCILTRRKKVLLTYQAFLGNSLEGDKPLPACTITISDGRYMHMSHDETWLDLISDEELESLPRPAATHIVGDIPVIYLRALERIQKLGRIEHDADT